MVFPVGEWIAVEGVALKLAGNPMFDADGPPPKAAVVAPVPEPEPDPESDEDSPVSAETAPAQEGPTADELRAKLDLAGVKYHHLAGAKKLAKLWAEHEKGAGA